MRLACGASVSKSASQIHDTSRPSAMRSLSTIHTSSPAPSAAARVRNTSFAPAGFLTSRIASLRPPTAICSARPNAAAKVSSPRRTSSRVMPSCRHVAAAPSAL